MALLDNKTLKAAVLNVAKWGDTDIFPFPVENHVMHDKADTVTQLLAEIAKNFDDYILKNPIEHYSTLAPVSHNGFRWATQIDPLWNAYLLSLVLSLAQDIEDSRLPRSQEAVYSYRYQPEEDGSIFDQNGWQSFQQRARGLAEAHKYVVSVDISDFYSRIYHHRLENALNPLDKGSTRAKQIMTILGKLSNGTSYGLPVGGPAARILAELLLNRVDHLIISEPKIIGFCRYADDYRFFVDDLESAYHAIGFLSEKLLRNEGLSLQKSKTRIMTSSEYLSLLDPINPPRGSAARFLGLQVHFDPYSATAEEDYDRLKSQIEEFDIADLLRAEIGKGKIHSALTRRLISAVRFMDPTPKHQTILSLIDNLDTLAPVTPQVMLATRSAIEESDNEEFAENVHTRIRSLVDSSHYLTKIDLNLSYMLRVLSARRSMLNEQLMIGQYQAAHGFSGTPSPLIQRDIMLTLSRWKANYWLSDQKNYFNNFHPWLRRAFIIGSYLLGDEGRHWRQNNKLSFGEFDSIVRDWISEKINLPNWEVPI